MHRSILALCLTAAALAVSACDEGLSSVAGPTPNLTATFDGIQRDVFGAGDSSGRRACAACHTANGRTPAAGLNLDGPDAYNNLVGKPSARKPGATLIVPGDPENSYLIQKIEGRAGIIGVRMPINGPYLTDGQTLILKRWIEIGAPRN